jgi:hypothetical protein
MLNSSQSIKEIASALSNAQAEMPSLEKNTKNPYFSTKYADLGEVIEKSVPVLKRYGLSISQVPTSNIIDGLVYIGVRTVLMHSSGEFIEDTLYLPLIKSDSSTKSDKHPNYPQIAGIIVTYLRRYGWSSVLGLYADEDTDGESPSNKGRNKTDDGGVVVLRKYLKELFEQKPENQDAHRATIKELGYTNDCEDVELIKVVIARMIVTNTTKEETQKENK